MDELVPYQGQSIQPCQNPEIWPDVPGEIHEFQLSQCVIRILRASAIRSFVEDSQHNLKSEDESEYKNLPLALEEAFYKELDPVTAGDDAEGAKQRTLKTCTRREESSS